MNAEDTSKLFGMTQRTDAEILDFSLLLIGGSGDKCRQAAASLIAAKIALELFGSIEDDKRVSDPRWIATAAINTLEQKHPEFSRRASTQHPCMPRHPIASTERAPAMTQEIKRALPRGCLVDLDNCIAHDSWRLHMFELHKEGNARYAKYHESCAGDWAGNIDLYHELLSKFEIVIATSRPNCVRIKTEDWLRKNGFPFHRLLMRPDDCHVESVPLKRNLLEAARITHDVCYAIDDRQDILDMYEGEGVPETRRVWLYNPT